MKALETITYQSFSLTVLVEELALENDKANVSYFINGNEVTEWGKIKPVFQELFTHLSNELCKNLGLTKWIY